VARGDRGIPRPHRPAARTAWTITLREGGTPIVAPVTGSLGLTGAQVWLKVEGSNPTGSFKDRGMTTAMSVGPAEGAKLLCVRVDRQHLCVNGRLRRPAPDSSHSCSSPQGKIAAGKMAQAIVHGAQIIMVRGNFDHCLRMSRELADNYPVALVNSVNPMRLQGPEDRFFRDRRLFRRRPRLSTCCRSATPATSRRTGWAMRSTLGCGRVDQVASHARLAGRRGCAAGDREPRSPTPETKATAIRIGNPASWHLAEAGGSRSRTVGSSARLRSTRSSAAQAELARRDGVFVEPA
jgi:threonine synthase